MELRDRTGRFSKPVAAISTPAGVSAIGVVRVTGENSILLVSDFLTIGKELPVRTATFCKLARDGKPLDEAIVTAFKGPHSFTGEDMVEISCHGSPFILSEIMHTLIEAGVRPAEPGEFTMRAFLNGKIDLVQAEAIADLIASESSASHSAAMAQLRGGLSDTIRRMRTELVDFVSLLELELDFSEEDVEFADRRKLKLLLDNIRQEIILLIDSFRIGNAVKEGVKVVIAGRPNSGKSTLLNLLLNDEKAIVSEIPGTTRDFIEDVITVGGFRVRFIDTAGIRETSDQLEKIGIARSWEKIKKADLIIYVFDVNEIDAVEVEQDVSAFPKGIPVLIAGNKTDLDPDCKYKLNFASVLNTLFISARGKSGINDLKDKIIELVGLNAHISENSLVTNTRHLFELKRTLVSINAGAESLDAGRTTELVSSDLRTAIEAIGSITGEVTSDEILGNIFGRFCIGK